MLCTVFQESEGTKAKAKAKGRMVVDMLIGEGERKKCNTNGMDYGELLFENYEKV